MAENTEQRQPTHRIFAVIRGEQGDTLIDIGHLSPRSDGQGYDALLHVMPADGEIMCREITACDPGEDVYARISTATPEQDTMPAAQ
jgi:hypothetical protein